MKSRTGSPAEHYHRDPTVEGVLRVHIVLAGLGAAVVGVGDFLGGTGSRKDVPHAVAALSFLAGGAFLACLLPFVDGVAALQDILWGAVSGLGGAVGVFALYRGFQHAPMGLVSPIAAVVMTAVPVVGGLALGERIGPATMLGLALGLAAVVLVSLAPGPTAGPAARRSALSHGVITGIGFGVLLLALALVGDGAGLAPVVASRLVSFGVLVGQGLVVGRSMFPRRGVRLISTGAGVFTATGNALYYLAVGVGPIVASTAVYALFPVTTVVMARLVHNERMTSLQTVGVVAALTAAVLLTVAG